MFSKKFHIFKKFPFRKSVIFKNYVFSHKIPCFFKKFPIFKNSPFEKIRNFQNYVFSHPQNSVFFKKFRVFKNSPFEKVCTFQNYAFFNKICFVDINICVSPILYGTFVILYPTQLQNPAKNMRLSVLFQHST